MSDRASTVLIAGALAGILSGIPSTFYLLLTGGDLFASMRALVAMVTASDLPVLQQFLVAGAVHFAVSFFWAAALVALLPRRAPVESKR